MVRRLGVLLYFEKKEDLYKRSPDLGKKQSYIRGSSGIFGDWNNKLTLLTDDEACEFVLWLGTKQLIKRRKFDEYIEKLYAFLLEL